MTLSRRAFLALAWPAFAQRAARFRLINAGPRWCFLSPAGRPFFPLFGSNASLASTSAQAYLEFVDTSNWPARELAPRQPAAHCLGLAWRLPSNPMAAIRALGSDHELKSRWVDFLKERYEYNIAEVNRAYALESTSFSDLLIENFKQLDPQRPAVRRDDSGFLEGLRDQIEKEWTARFELPVFRLGESINARPEIWTDRFDPSPPPNIVGMKAPESGAEAWLLSREKQMADWTADSPRR